MIHKRSRISEPLPSLSHNAQESTAGNGETLIFDESFQPNKRIKSEMSTAGSKSGFVPIDTSKLDLPFLKTKINQVLKSFDNKKKAPAMDKKGQGQQPHSAQSQALDSTLKANQKLDRYISRAYKKCVNAKEQAYMSGLLEQIIQESQKQGDFGTRNWDLASLPLLPREKQDNLNLVLNSQFLQINKNANSSLLSAIPKAETQQRVNPREPQLNFINSLLMPPPTHPTQLLNSLKLNNMDLRDQNSQSRFQQPIGRGMPMPTPMPFQNGGQINSNFYNPMVHQLHGQYPTTGKTNGPGKAEPQNYERLLKEKHQKNDKLSYRIDTSAINGNANQKMKSVKLT